MTPLRSVRAITTPLLVSGLVASVLVLGTEGCGSGSGNRSIVVNPAGPAYIGRTYTSQVTLADGQTGMLRTTVAADNTATGTLEINDVSPLAQTARAGKSRLVIATPFLSGTFNSATGLINLSGSYTLGGRTIPISIVGTLPFPPATNGGSVVITVDGVAYTSTFGGTVTNPTPSPSTTPTPTATPTPNPTPTLAPGAVNTVTLTPVAGTSPNNSVSKVVGVNGIAILKEYTPASPFSRIAFELNDGSDHIINLAVITAAPLAPGTYPIKIDPSSFTAPGAGASYREGAGFTTYWQAGGVSFADVEGTLVVDQVDANKVRVQILDVRIEARAVGTSLSKGNLRLKGVVETTTAPTFVTQ